MQSSLKNSSIIFFSCNYLQIFRFSENRENISAIMAMLNRKTATMAFTK
jgi:hypothetical protein